MVESHSNGFGRISKAVTKSALTCFSHTQFSVCSVAINWAISAHNQSNSSCNPSQGNPSCNPRAAHFQVFSPYLAQMAFGPTPVPISKDDYKSFHTIDRQLYVILVTELRRDPYQAMQVMALWLWLETIGFYNIIRKILPLPPTLITELVDEALACLNSIYGPHFLYPTQATDINLTQVLVAKEISLSFFREKKESAKTGLIEVNKKVCENALTDLLKEAVEVNRMGLAKDKAIGGPRPQMARGVHPDDRTMFVTFSKGYPVSESEVRQFFGGIFGECIQSFHMQEAKPREQALYARIIFYRPSIIDVILNGMVKAKLTINGKHVWMRRFIPRSERR